MSWHIFGDQKYQYNFNYKKSANSFIRMYVSVTCEQNGTLLWTGVILTTVSVYFGLVSRVRNGTSEVRHKIWSVLVLL